MLEVARSAGHVDVVQDEIPEQADVILYRYKVGDDVETLFSSWQNKIKLKGRIWLIIPRKEAARKRGLNINWAELQQMVLKTKLVDNKITALTDEEYGTQFMLRKEFRRSQVDKQI